MEIICFSFLQVAVIRKHLAKIYEDCQEWREAARVLTGIPVESGQRFGALVLFSFMECDKMKAQSYHGKWPIIPI